VAKPTSPTVKEEEEKEGELCCNCTTAAWFLWGLSVNEQSPQKPNHLYMLGRIPQQMATPRKL
jgi:hypothetical protein